MRKSFTTSLDKEIVEQFRQSCEDYGLKMNIVIESLMNDFSNGNYLIIVTKSGLTIKKEG